MAEALGDIAIQARVLDLVALLELLPDPRKALPILERATALAREAQDEWCVAETEQNIGWALVLTGDYDAGRASLETAYELADRLGFRDLVTWHWFMAGHTAYPRGEHEDARSCWERSVDGSTSGVPEGVATWSLSALDIDAGQPAAALARLADCRSRMVTAGAGLALPILEAGRGRALAALGRFDEAAGALLAAIEEADGFTWIEAIARFDLTRVHLLRGEQREAAVCAERALAVAANHLCHEGFIARAHHEEARIAAAEGDWTGAERLAHEALGAQAERGERLDMPDSLDVLAEIAAGVESHEEAARLLGACDRARAEIARVRWQPEQERTDALIAQLREELGDDAYGAAYAEGEALMLSEAVAYVRRARGERKRPSGGWESLTPTELEIVRHAATGLTNPEIGERMFISRGTVKVHLSHIYAKLGLRNRSEVAAEAIRRQAADDPAMSQPK